LSRVCLEMIAQRARQRDKEKNGKINVGIGATRERKWFMNGAEYKEIGALEQGEVKQSGNTGNNMIDRPRKVADLVFCTLGRSRLFLELLPFMLVCMYPM
jgi:hypothetical protein